jgi:hypothetical protein
MNANIPPLKILIPAKFLTQDETVTGFEKGYAFAIISHKGRALQFHVLLESGAHFRHIPLHWLLHDEPTVAETNLEDLQLWDCFSFKPIVTVFDFLKDYQCDVLLKDKSVVSGTYYCTVDWLADCDTTAGFLHQPDQNKCGHIILLDDGRICCLPTNRVCFKDAFFIGNAPNAAARKYKTIDTIFQAENSDRWSVANTDETFYR